MRTLLVNGDILRIRERLIQSEAIQAISASNNCALIESLNLLKAQILTGKFSDSNSYFFVEEVLEEVDDAIQ